MDRERPLRAFALPLRLFAAAVFAVAVLVGILDALGLSERLTGGLLAAAVLLAFLALGVVGRSLSLSEFRFGSAMLPVHGGMATAGSFLASFGFLGLAALFFAAPETALLFVLGAAGGFLLLALVVAPFVRAAGAATLPDFFAARFGGAVFALVAALLVVLASFFLLSLELAVAGRLLGRLLSLEPLPAVALAAAIVLVPALLGGLRAQSLVAAGAFLLAAAAFLLPLILHGAAEFGMPLPELAAGAALERIAAFPAVAVAALSSAVPVPAGLPGPGLGTAESLAVLLTVATAIAAFPHLVMRSGLSTAPAHARRSGAFAFVFVLLLATAAPAYAAFGRAILLDGLVGLPLAALPDWVFDLGRLGLVAICGVPATAPGAVAAACAPIGVSVLDPGHLGLAGAAVVLGLPALAGLSAAFGLLLAVGAVAAAVGAGGALLLAVASAAGNDLYLRLVDRAAPAGRRLIALRAALIAACLAAAWLALAGPQVAARWAPLAPSLVASGFFPPLILGLWWRRCTSLGALAGMLAGAFLAFFYFVVTAIEGDPLWSWFGLSGTAVPPFAGAAFGLPVAFAVAVLVSLLTPAQPERAAFLDRVRTPAGLPRAAEDD